MIPIHWKSKSTCLALERGDVAQKCWSKAETQANQYSDVDPLFIDYHRLAMIVPVKSGYRQVRLEVSENPVFMELRDVPCPRSRLRAESFAVDP